MAYQEVNPCESLRSYLRCFWHIEEDHALTDNHEEATPDSYIEVIFNIGDPCYLQTEYEVQLPDVFLVGLQDKPLRFHTTGVTNLIGLRFYAWGVLPFADLSIPPINSPPLPLEAGWQALFLKLQETVPRCTFQELALMIEAFLLRQFDPALTNDSHLPQVGQQLYATQGQGRIDELAAYCSFSKRQLERQFKSRAGITPKQLARAIRFESIALRLFEDPNLNLLDLAYEFGYTDQSHFIHDFKDFAEVTPGEFASAMRVLSRKPS